MKVILFLILITVTISIRAQVQWTKYINNPVFTKGPEFYDLVAVGQPTVLLENDTIKMWYAAVGGDMKSRIGYAFSTDGINWIKYPDIVINTGYSGEWDSEWLDTPEILKVDSGYLLYFYGDSIGYDTNYTHYESVTHSAIGVAYSTDGVNWTKYAGNPVFSKGNYGDWDGTWIESPAILKDITTGKLMMWYNGIDTITWKMQIGLATSNDGINWIRNTENPVLTNGTVGNYDDMWLGTPAVIYRTDHYEMWYSSAASQDYNNTTKRFDTLRICFATSSDGINWIKYTGNPLFNTATAPYDTLVDRGGPWAPDVIFKTDSNQYEMWFETDAGLLLATSPANFAYVKKHPEFTNDALKIYPNPSSACFTVDFSNMPGTKWNISLFNINGIIKLQRENIVETKCVLSAENIPKGIYLLKLSNRNGQVITKKIIIN